MCARRGVVSWIVDPGEPESDMMSALRLGQRAAHCFRVQQCKSREGHVEVVSHAMLEVVLIGDRAAFSFCCLLTPETKTVVSGP